MTLRIPEAELAKAFAHARETVPEECCGFLIGTRRGTRDVTEVRRATNVHPDHREVRYTVDPRQHLHLEVELRTTNREILGFYHSHPNHPGVPSAFDVERSWLEYAYVIIEVRDSRPLRARGFLMNRETGAVVEEPLVVLGATLDAPPKRRRKSASRRPAASARSSPKRVRR